MHALFAFREQRSADEQGDVVRPRRLELALQSDPLVLLGPVQGCTKSWTPGSVNMM